MSPKVLIWPLCGLALTLTFALLTSSESYQLIFVPDDEIPTSGLQDIVSTLTDF